MEEERRILEEMIDSSASYEDIVKKSQQLDQYIIDYYKENRRLEGQA